ncbi:MAG: UxaA family hydrolase [Negativicutes bacterium]|nr:UxaA family hydrolase [Negativicutes bacterium]
MKFMGYRRPDGKVGVRNHVLILPTVTCANHVARSISLGIKGTMWVEHAHGCSRLSPDAVQAARVFVGHGAHPNVFGVVVVGLGCELIRAQNVAAEIKKQCPDKPVHVVIIQEEGGTFGAVQAGSIAAQKMVLDASLAVREPIDVSELILGTECGGSDACSGLSANPALGAACDLLIDAGGTAILGETPELMGAEHLLAARAVNKDVGARCIETVEEFEKSMKTVGVDLRGTNPSPGNIEGGLSSIEEKSLGCIYKAGTRPVQDVIKYAQPIEKKGLIFMDTTGNDAEQLSGMVAGGCHIVVFTTGRGNPMGSPIAPTVKVSSNTFTFEKMRCDMDVNAGTIITGEETVQQVGQRIFEEVIAAASGKLTRAEATGHNDFAVWGVWPTV